MGDVANKKYEPMNMPSDTLVIHCVDHRFQEAFRKFIAEELGIAVFNPVVIAGGALAVASDHFAKFGYIWDQIDFFITMGGVKRVVLINHDDCLWYKKEKPGLEKPELRESGKNDLVRAAINIGERYPAVEIIPVWAELDGSNVSFNIIDLTNARRSP